MRKSSLRREQFLTGASLSRSIKPSAAALAVAACFSGAALANPVNPTVVHGTATFQQAGNILNVTNSANAIINWGSFSINVGELTRFIQPSALSAVLNRVTGQDPSAILGALQSNGRVFLVNPNGIVFGAGAQIDVAGLVASTLNLSNEDFLNNRMRFTDGAGAGSIVNQGQITGGSVYLVGNAVTNNGLITSPNGEVVLAAGNSVELVNPGSPNLRVEITAPDNEARNLGSISAEAGRIGIYAGLIHNSGSVNASSAVVEGGRILLKAKKDITLESTSVIDASGQGGGEIIAFADNNMYVDGTLNASAPVSGDGGFIETSGKNRVKVGDSAFITTQSTSGKTGTWLIDPNDYVINAYGGDISGSALGSMLGSTNVVIESTNGSGSYGGGNGDILVNDSIYWTSSNSLTLTAERNVNINSSIDGAEGGLNVFAGWDGSSDASNPTLISGRGTITSNSTVYVGSLHFKAGQNISIEGGEGLFVGGTLKLEAGNDIFIGNSSGYSGVDVRGNSETIATAGRNLSVVAAEGEGVSSSTLGGYSSVTTIKTGGNVLVEKSTIRGNPDVVMTVGGVININGEVNNPAGIRADSPRTIQITFTNLTSGGYSVNGVAGLIYDEATDTGFWTFGSAAVLGESLKVTYGGSVSSAPPPPPTDTLIVAIGESTKPPDPEKDKDVFEDIEEKKKKEAPVCR